MTINIHYSLIVEAYIALYAEPGVLVVAVFET